MNNPSEKVAFSTRLKDRLALHNWPVNSPTWLAREFNIRFKGHPVSVQAASNWLSAGAIPNQEKLQVLAVWLGVSSQWLRFGDEALGSNEVKEDQRAYAGVSQTLTDLPDKLAQLNPKQKQAVYYVIDAMLDGNQQTKK